MITNHVAGSMVLTLLFVRTYRRYQILIKHKVGLWNPWTQTACTLPFTLLSVYSGLIRRWGSGQDFLIRNQDTLVCLRDPNEEAFPPNGPPWFQWLFTEEGDKFLFWMPLTVILLSLAYLNFQLRSVRAQLNEYVIGLVLELLYIVAHVPRVLQWDSRLQAIAFGYLSVTLFWGLLGEAFTALMSQDHEYERVYMYGFSKLPTSADLQASLGEQLTIPQIRKLWNRFATERHAQENLHFYEDCIKLAEETGWFARQAGVMRIMDKYIRPGSRSEINISDSNRKKVMNGCINDVAIFRPAMAEVISMLHGMRIEFEESASVKAFQEQVRIEEAEKDALRAGGLLNETAGRTFSTETQQSAASRRPSSHRTSISSVVTNAPTSSTSSMLQSQPQAQTHIKSLPGLVLAPAPSPVSVISLSSIPSADKHTSG